MDRRREQKDPACALEIRALSFTWPGRDAPVLGIDALRVERGESVLLQGPSGSGKSTLLAAIAGVVEIGEGCVTVCGEDVGALRGGTRDRFRAAHIGVIFQVFNLIPWLSAPENILLPCRFSARRRARAGADPHAAAMRLLAELGIEDAALLAGPAGALSIGQQQRVAAARALIGAPELILADEPTSALDAQAKGAFVDLLQRECRAANAGLLFVSHDRSLAPHFDRVVPFEALNRALHPC
jgi:putative ABC transport system ATP-binding protein